MVTINALLYARFTQFTWKSSNNRYLYVLKQLFKPIPKRSLSKWAYMHITNYDDQTLNAIGILNKSIFTNSNKINYKKKFSLYDQISIV